MHEPLSQRELEVLKLVARGTTNRELSAAPWIGVVGLMWIATTPITALGALIGLGLSA
jgi:hypothetical protein